MATSVYKQQPLTYFFSRPAKVKSEGTAPQVEKEEDNDVPRESCKDAAKSELTGSDCDSPVKKTPGTKKKKVLKIESDDEDAEESSKSSPVKKSKTPSPEKKERKSPSPKKETPKATVLSQSQKKSSGGTKTAKRKLSPSEPKTVKAKRIKEEEKEEEEEAAKDKEEEIKEKELSEDEPQPKESEKPKVHPFFSSNKKKSADVKEAPSEVKKDQKKKNEPTQLEPGADYDPSKRKYHVIDDAFWGRNESVPYLALARTLEAIESTSARLKMIDILANFLRSVIVLTPQDLLPAVYLCLNKLAPAYEGMELGIAEGSLMKIVAQATGRSLAQIKADAAEAGDLGIVAEQSRSTQRQMFKPAPLKLRTVFEKLKEIASMTGHASMSKKADKIQSMFVACRYSEARYFIRSLTGKLRIGLAEQSALQALAQACTMTPPGQDFPPAVINALSKLSPEAAKAKVEEQALILKTAYCECPSYDRIIDVILREGVSALPNHCTLTPGIPLKPMLAHPTKDINEILSRFENAKFTCEWKYDGERAQIHVLDDGSVRIYSRNQENNTSKYPDIISRMPMAFKDEKPIPCILDSEAVAFDQETKQILPFQVLSTRKKKDTKEEEIKVQVCVVLFDLLYLNGRSLVREPLLERRKLLQEHFKVTEGKVQFATSVDFCSSLDGVQEFLEEAVKGNCEGLMVKTLEKDASYEIARRSHKWLKLKKDYLEGIGDTLDVIPIGGYLGKGRRTGTYGGFLLACYDHETEEYQSLCKIGTGFTDDDLAKHSAFFKEHVIQAPRPYYRFDPSLAPDHWFDAVQVWEIKCADLSLSPIHKAAQGMVDPEKGVSLRFPRFLRIRDDKSPEDSTFASQIAEMYHSQEQIINQKQNGAKKTKDEDFY